MSGARTSSTQSAKEGEGEGSSARLSSSLATQLNSTVVESSSNDAGAGSGPTSLVVGTAGLDAEPQAESLGTSTQTSPQTSNPLHSPASAPAPPSHSLPPRPPIPTPSAGPLFTTGSDNDDAMHGRRRQSAPAVKGHGIRSISFGRFYGQNQYSNEWEKWAGKELDQLFLYPSGRDGARIVVNVSEPPKDRLSRPTSSIRITIKATSVDRIQSTSLTSGKNILFFHLSYPPTFEQVDQMDDSRRSIQTIRVSSFNAEHEKVSRWTSTTFAVELASHNALVDVVAKLTATGLPRPVVDNISVQARKLYARWPEVKQFLASLDITVGFQLESLLSTSLLDANQLAELRPTISAILRDHRKQGERILITFATRLSGLVTVKVPTAERAPKKKKGIDYLVLSDSDDSEAEEEGNGDDATFKLINQGQRQASTTFTTVQLEQHLQDSVAFATAPAATTAFEPLDKQGASRAVIITPTRMILQGPTFDSESNAIIRDYGCGESFLRISIRDEDGSQLRNHEIAILDHHFAPTFKRGVEVCGRNFELLAWSSSSLRNHSAFFVAPFFGATAATLRYNLGKFQNVKGPALFMARVGQALTASRAWLDVSEFGSEDVGDIISESGSVMTDGVGLISSRVAALIVEALGDSIKRDGTIPTCFQFRMGGYKGMLQVDPTLNEDKIVFRTSQKKFKSESHALAIVQAWRALPAFLNRPLIALLETLGVAPQAFLKLQKDALKGVRRLRDGSDPLKASRILDMWNMASATRLAATMREFSLAKKELGAAILKNDFVQRTLLICSLHLTRELKYKARVPIPDAYQLVGVADHGGYLKEGEIYARIGSSPPLHGIYAISRSPTMHPGDVQLVRAVGRIPSGDGNEIRGLVDCVVFSTQGSRSLPSQLAGGDLDGDIFCLLPLASGLAPTPANIAKPAGYEKPVGVGGNMQAFSGDRDAAPGFFFHYVKMDLTGPIASRHLILSDMYTEGVKHYDCIKLAEMHSDSVDFVKSGIAVDRNNIPREPFDRRGHRPDYDARDVRGQTVYQSPKALGQLFRAIDESEILGPKPRPLPPSLDPLGQLTSLLRSTAFPGLPGTSLSSPLHQPSNSLIKKLTSFIQPFGIELIKLHQLVSTTRGSLPSEPELFLGIFVGEINPIRAKRDAYNRFRERTGDLFAIVRNEFKGQSTLEGVQKSWAGWLAAVGYEEKAGKETGVPFGVSSFAMLALGELSSGLSKLAREKKAGEMEVIVIDDD